MYDYYKKDERTDNERYLENELERVQQEQRDADDRRERAREQSARERKEEREYEMRQADSWPEALGKDISLLSREIDLEFEAGDGDFFFTDSANACRRALEIWSERERAHAERIAELRLLIAHEKESIKQEVSDKLEKETPVRSVKGVDKQSYGWSCIATSIRDFEYPSELLNW